MCREGEGQRRDGDEVGHPGRAKSNIGPDDGGLVQHRQTSARAIPHTSASVILWGNSLSGTARELLADAEADDDSDGDHRRVWRRHPQFSRRWAVPHSTFKADAEVPGITGETCSVRRRSSGLSPPGRDARRCAVGFHARHRRHYRIEGDEDATNLCVPPLTPRRLRRLPDASGPRRSEGAREVLSRPATALDPVR